MKKMKNFLIIIAVVAATMVISSDAFGQGMVKNLTKQAVVIKDIRLRTDLHLRIGETAWISADPGVNLNVPVFTTKAIVKDKFGKDSIIIDTTIITMNFAGKGSIFNLTDEELAKGKKMKPAQTFKGSSAPTASANLKSAPVANLSPTTTPEPENYVPMVGKRVKNDLDAILFFQDRGICLAPGKTSINLVQLSPNERIIIERNNRLFFLEINDFFASNDKIYVVNEETLLRGEGQDSVKISLTAGNTPYVFIDDKTKEVKGIREQKGRGGYAKNFAEGANTIMCQILKNGVAQTRYYTFMASRATSYVSPSQLAFDNPPLFQGRAIYLPIKGFDKNCAVEFLDIDGRNISERIVLDENGTSVEQEVRLGMNRVRVTFFERTPQGRVRYSIEYFKLVTEADKEFKIDPEYFWLLEGPPVAVRPKNGAKSRLFQDLEIWASDKKSGEPKKLVIKKDYPSEVVHLREGIVRLPGRYTEGLSIRNLTCTFIISYMDKNKDVLITDENIDRSQE
ncbi:MAG: hypothetical protein WC545_02945 [Patescibacteria group bacterium]